MAYGSPRQLCLFLRTDFLIMCCSKREMCRWCNRAWNPITPIIAHELRCRENQMWIVGWTRDCGHLDIRFSLSKVKIKKSIYFKFKLHVVDMPQPLQ